MRNKAVLRVVSFILTLTLLVPMIIVPSGVAQAASPTISYGDRVAVTDAGGGVAIRVSYSTGSALIRTMPAGYEGKVIDGPQYNEGYRWWRIQWVTGDIGWTADASLGGTAYMQPLPGTGIYPNVGNGGLSYRVRVYSDAVNLAVRTGPSTAYSLITRKAPGSRGWTLSDAPVISQQMVWWRIQWDDAVIGWSSDSRADIEVGVYLVKEGSGPFPTCSVSTPSVPSGTTSGTINTSYIYSTGGSSCSAGHSVQYRFDWGDGTYSSWSSSTSASKSWSSAGTYQVRAQARCATSGATSSWSSARTVSISAPCSVSTPSVPSGTTSGTINTSYIYSTGGSSCSAGHSVQYRFDWGDGTYSSWSSSTSASKSWSSAGTYQVRAQARCATHTGVVSAWSSPLAVSISEPSEAISAPSRPSGSTSGTVGTSYIYTTGGASSNLGHSVQYYFNWGDGTNSGWLPVGTTSATKSWSLASTDGWAVSARARCATHTGVVSAWSSPLVVSISEPTPNELPTAYIDSITPNPATQGTHTVSFTGHGTDPDGSVIGYNWRSSKDGQLSTSSSFSKAASALSVGTHTIYFKVRDDDGAWSPEVMATLTIESAPTPNELPTAYIDSITPNPATQGTHTVSFTGHGTDPDGSVTGWSWRSSKNGTLGTSSSWSVAASALSVGTHTIYFKVKDDDGAWSAEVTATLTIESAPTPNELPTAYIDSITPNPATQGTHTVSFTGHGTDPDGFVVHYRWRSSKDGHLSTSSSFSKAASEMSAGTHTIYFKVKDHDGAWSPEVTGTLTITAPADPDALQPSEPVITSGLELSPSGECHVFDELSATFTVRNDNDIPITLRRLTVWGQDPCGQVVYFRPLDDVVLDSDEEYTYSGKFIPHITGGYQFTCAYQRSDGTWNTNLHTIGSVNRVQQIVVSDKYYLIGYPHKGRGGVVIPEDVFPAGKGEVIPIYVPEIVDSSNANFEHGDWQTIEEIRKADFDFDWAEFGATLNAPRTPGVDDGSIDVGSAGLVSLGAAALYSAGQASSVTTLTATIQKNSRGELRAILQIADVDANTFMRSSAGKSWIFTHTRIGPYAAHCELISKPIYHSLDLEPSCDYSLGWRLGKEHANDEYIAYLSFVRDNELTITPKIYADDALKVVRLDWSGLFHTDVYEWTGNGYANLMEGPVTGQMAVRIAKLLASASMFVVSEPGMLSEIKSPAELRVYDSEGRVTGLVDGVAREEIPQSIYDEQNEIVVIMSANDTYTHVIAGTDDDMYGLHITCIEDGKPTILDACDIPTTDGALHEYSVNWNALSQGADGVQIRIDSDGDGEFEHEFASDGEITRNDLIPQSACFIATAAYGTPMAEEIGVLREFRDDFLLTDPIAQTLVDLYYRVSPPIAGFITEHPSLKPIVRAGLAPAVTFSTVAVNTSPADKGAMAGLLVLVSVAVVVWTTNRQGRGKQRVCR